MHGTMQITAYLPCSLSVLERRYRTKELANAASGDMARTGGGITAYFSRGILRYQSAPSNRRCKNEKFWPRGGKYGPSGSADLAVVWILANEMDALA
jgi:hypothetical protein